jgi:hypothetical protein
MEQLSTIRREYFIIEKHGLGGTNSKISGFFPESQKELLDRETSNQDFFLKISFNPKITKPNTVQSAMSLISSN